jgi:hypothetical protein
VFEAYPRRDPTFVRAPLRLMVLDLELRGVLLLTDHIQSTPQGGRCVAYVAMSRQPAVMRFIGRQVDCVIQGYEEAALCSFDWYHILLLGSAVADPTGTYVVVTPVLPRDRVAGVLRGEEYWRARYEEMVRKYEADTAKLLAESQRTVDAMRAVLHRVAETAPSAVDTVEYVLGMREAAFVPEKFTAVREAEAVEAPPRRPPAARRLAEALRRLVGGGGT